MPSTAHFLYQLPELHSVPALNFRRVTPSCTTMNIFHRFFCLLGFHDFHVVEATLGFGLSGAVEKVECSRCGYVITRRQRTGNPPW